MSAFTRGEFLGSAAAALGVGILSGCEPGSERASDAAGGSADLIVHGGGVYTVDDGQPTAESFAVRGDRFVAVGSPAPDFALRGATRFGVLAEPVSLSDYSGKTVVLAFFFRARGRG